MTDTANNQSNVPMYKYIPIHAFKEIFKGGGAKEAVALKLIFFF